MSIDKKKVIKLAGLGKESMNIKKFTDDLLASGAMETAYFDPEREVELAVLDLADKGLVSSGKFASLRLAKYLPEERKVMISDIKRVASWIGMAGEYLTLSQLMFQKIPAMKPPVDEGFDIIAFDNKRNWRVQVKTSFLNSRNRYTFNISKISKNLNDTDKNNIVYVFILTEGLDGKNDFLVINHKELENQIKLGNIYHYKKANQVRVNIFMRDGNISVGNLGNDMGKFLNNWKVFGGKIIGKSKEKKKRGYKKEIKKRVSSGKIVQA